MPQKIDPPGVGGKKKKKGRAPKHQNTFAFRHNPKSKKTERILSLPNVGVCRRCHDKIEWRKKYRKYKPRSQPSKCNLCSQKNVMAAYHTICTKCAMGDIAIAAMEKYIRETSAACLSNNAADEPDLNVHGITCATFPNEDEKSDSKSSHEPNDPAFKIDCAESQSSVVVNENTKSKRKIRVCAMCTHEAALSRYDNSDSEAVELIDQIHELEDTLESGVHKDDGHKFTLREIKCLERQIEKLRLDIKEKKYQKNQIEKNSNSNDGEKDDSEDDSDISESASSNDEDGDYDEENDPFLIAIGGKDKLLVGEKYQKMLLEKEKQNLREV